nr:hypothetical protein [Megavirus caiporensis]
MTATMTMDDLVIFCLFLFDVIIIEYYVYIRHLFFQFLFLYINLMINLMIDLIIDYI